MMLFQLVLFTFSATSLAALGLVLHNIIMCQIAYLSFKIKSKNLPMYEFRRLLGNHTSLAFEKDTCNIVSKSHAKLGNTFGWLYNYKPAVSTIDLDLIKLMIFDEPDKHMNRIVLDLPWHEIEQSLMMIGDDDWRKVRRHFAPAFKSAKFKTPNVISEIEASIKKLIDHIELKLEERRAALGSVLKEGGETKEFHMDELVHRYQLNLVLSCFYKQHDLIDFNAEHCYWTKVVEDGLGTGCQSMAVKTAVWFPLLKSTIDWLIWHFHPQGKWRQTIMGFVKTQAKLALEARKQGKEQRTNRGDGKKVDLDNFVMRNETSYKRNMIDHVIDHFLDGRLTKDEFFNSSCFIVGAADKTASDSLVHTLYLLGRHSEAQNRLRKSIQAEGVDSEYLAWVLNESLRLLPPVPLGCTRTVTRDIQLADNMVVPANTLVATPAYTIHRLKEYWGDDAEEFKPERWQDTSHFHPMQYIPFGAGPRACPGREFALFEMKMLMVAMLTRYTFECKHKDDAYVFSSLAMIYVVPNSPTYVTIKKLPEAGEIL